MAKTILITGANSGIGLAAGRLLAKKGYKVIAWCRSKQKGEKALEEIRNANPDAQPELVLADLGDLKAVKAAADDVLARHPKLDVLLNNAGYYPSEVRFVDGVEESLHACQLGHMLLSLTLMPALKASGEGRIVNVSSAAHAMGKFERIFNAPEKYSEIQVYSDVKLANILMAKGLIKNTDGPITAYSLHPGVVNTNFGENVSGFFKFMIKLATPFMLTEDKGARTSVYLSSAPLDKIKAYNGDYFAKSKRKKIGNKDVNDANVDVLWNKSMEYIQPYL